MSPPPADLYPVNRGGSWGNRVRLARLADRCATDSSFWDPDLGLRLLRRAP